MLIDLHFHCLPGIDDGPRSWDEAVALCRSAADDGSTHVVATPHVLREPWINDDPVEREALVAKLNELLGGCPVVLPGCEYFFSVEAVDLLEKGRPSPLTTLNRGQFLLVEFSPRGVPRQTEAVFHELMLLGITPLIAHPERNLELAEHHDRLAGLVERGAAVQLTAGSFLGEFGRRAMESAIRMVDDGLAYVVASDSHSLDRRPPRMRAARTLIEAKWGNEVAVELFETHPAQIAGSLASTPRFETRASHS